MNTRVLACLSASAIRLLDNDLRQAPEHPVEKVRKYREIGQNKSVFLQSWKLSCEKYAKDALISLSIRPRSALYQRVSAFKRMFVYHR